MSGKLVCKIKTEGTLIHVLCPSIGSIKLKEEPGQILSGGQIIGDLIRVGEYFKLALPLDISGQVLILDAAPKLCYAEKILTLDAAATGQARPEHHQSERPLQHLSIKATMDGMFYLSPSENCPPFVSIGDDIKPGQTIGLIEVMKCFYPMKYQGAFSAKILDVLVSNGTPVNSGMEIFRIS